MKQILIITTTLALSALAAKAETWDQASIDTEHALQNEINANAQFTRDENARRAREEARENARWRAEAPAQAEAQRRAYIEARNKEEAIKAKQYQAAIQQQNARHDAANGTLEAHAKA